jgi:hypothetical protein
MSTFAVTNSDQVISSINYLLSNLDTGNVTGNITVPDGTLIADPNTGQITATGNVTAGANVFSYINQFINLRYANNATGSSGFSTVPTNSQYFGVYNANIATPSANPAEYVWREVAGGFGTTKDIYYSSIGGRQVQFAAANTAPNSNFVISVANVAIDLDVITTAAGLPGERGPVVMAAVLTTADPVTASSSTLTGWFSSSRSSLTPPVGTGLTPVVGDTALFTYPVSGVSAAYEYNGSIWVSVTGQVISGKTIVDNTLNGVAVIDDTLPGTAVVANSLAGNKIMAGSITGDRITANTITSNNIAANTIVANNIAAGTITTDKLAANVLTANTVISTGATVGNFASPGFWLEGSTGNARFGNTVSIGNSLTIGNNLVIGNNASIGGNLTVSGLVTTGNLVANTVNTTQVVPAAISSGLSNTTTTTQTFTTPSQNTFFNINTTANIIPSFNGQTVYVWSQADITLDVNNGGNNSYVAVVTARLLRTNSANVVTVLSTQTVNFSDIGGQNPYVPFPLLRNTFVWGGLTDTLPLVILNTYSMQVSYAISGATVDSIIVGDRSILLQTLKR